MKLFRLIALLGVLLACASQGAAPSAQAQTIYYSGDTYAAIAYSPKTGAIGYAYTCGSRGQAERIALANCKAADARIVGWVHNGFLALALGDDKGAWGYGVSFGDGASAAEARGFALAECRSRTTGAHIVVCLSSFNVTPYVR